MILVCSFTSTARWAVAARFWKWGKWRLSKRAPLFGTFQHWLEKWFLFYEVWTSLIPALNPHSSQTEIFCLRLICDSVAPPSALGFHDRSNGHSFTYRSLSISVYCHILFMFTDLICNSFCDAASFCFTKWMYMDFITLVLNSRPPWEVYTL